MADCLGGMVLALSCKKRQTCIEWSGSNKTNLLNCKLGPSMTDENGITLDAEEKPLMLLKTIVQSLTAPHDWVLDAGSKTG